MKGDILSILQQKAPSFSKGQRLLARYIAEAYDKVGKEGIVQFTESEEVKDRIEISEGFRIDSGYASPYFINNAKGECVLENVVFFQGQM